ncbi:Jacalin-like lectin domain containing protein [Ceratobasidium theobromae]|uniref:Jacalin-like lectin domain containing protein n=1 Tax=Ceratobasidium theobromae TaxID=1582974 RepID=A0A5N5QDA3_9AGAM|nr:Jacalin-like lectin domain containing protein [Ceratobasidium theobromae]
MRPVAMPKRSASGPFIQEADETVTEIITTTNERETNYIQQGWSLSTASMIPAWASSRIANKNQPNRNGVWITKRTVLQRLTFSVLFEELMPVPEFEAEIKAALEKPTAAEKFQAVHKALYNWGDVIPLEIDVGMSLSITDSEANFAKLPNLSSDQNVQSLLASKTLRIAKRGGDTNDLLQLSISATAPPLQWRQVRVTEVAPTINLLNENLRSQLADLFSKRLTYAPPFPHDPTGGLKSLDDTQHASNTASSVIVRCDGYVDCLYVTYRTGGESNKHGGWGGTENKFPLSTGEYVTEMTAWADQYWVYSLQFVTNTGRRSPRYGGHSGMAVTTSGQGGALVGFSSKVRRHGQWGDLLGQVQGIWRHEFINTI